MHFTFEQERHISFGKLGNYGYKIEEKSAKKIPFLFIAESFLKEHHLTNKYPSFVLKPTVKINIAVISKYLETSTDELIKGVIDAVIDQIEQVSIKLLRS